MGFVALPGLSSSSTIFVTLANTFKASILSCNLKYHSFFENDEISSFISENKAYAKLYTKDMDKIVVVPNPYYGFSTLDRSTADKFITFRHLPLECTIKIYTLSGDLIRTLTKTTGSSPASSSTLEWNLQNQDKVPVATGIYIALIDAPGIGQKVLKIVVFTAQERINF